MHLHRLSFVFKIRYTVIKKYSIFIIGMAVQFYYL